MLRFSTVLALVLTAVGCGEELPQPQAPVPANPAVGVSILVAAPPGPPGPATALQGAIQQQLIGLGYRVVTDPAQAEVMVELSVNVQERPSAFVTYVNGVRQVNYTAHAVANTRGVDQMLGSASVDYDPANGPKPAHLGVLVASITRADLNGYAMRRRQQLAAMAAPRVQPATPPVAASQPAAPTASPPGPAVDAEEERAWAQVDIASCSRDTGGAGCGSIRQFRRKYPNGRHAADADRILAEATTPEPSTSEPAPTAAATRRATSSSPIPAPVPAAPKATSGCDAETAAWRQCNAGCPSGDAAAECQVRCKTAFPRSSCK